MIDWGASMQQTFEYYTVDPTTWRDVKKIDTTIKSTIKRDSSSETLGSATIDIGESLGESYIRIYLIAIQNGVKSKFPLGTFLIQTPSIKFDGMTEITSLDAYTPLLELKESLPPIGYAITKNRNIMEYAYEIVDENVRAPVIKTSADDTLTYDFIANADDTWGSFVMDLIANAKYSLDLDELGRVLFQPRQDIASLQPVWEYTDNNSSILYPDIRIDRDLYGIPNVVEVVYSQGTGYYYGIAENDNPDSPVSIQNRGRRITHRVTNPDMNGAPDEYEIQLYAERLLKNLSALEYTISYTHGYCPVRVGDCVRLNYSKAGIRNVKAKVISQSIECIPGCPVTEEAVFTDNLWKD